MWVEWWVFGLIPILFVALFIYLAVRVICALFRGLSGLLGFGEHRDSQRLPAPPDRRPAAIRTGSRFCPNPRCRRANMAVAHYCAQCGQRL